MKPITSMSYPSGRRYSTEELNADDKVVSNMPGVALVLHAWRGG
jgi:hypothetical protein